MSTARLITGDVRAVLAISDWPNNAAMIADCARLGYLGGHVLDPTWGRGKWWTIFKPTEFTRHDLYTLDGVDFRKLPEDEATFDAVAFDPPYKLNGTPALGDGDNRYGVDISDKRWQTRMQVCRDGITECSRVLKVGGYLLVKCQDQVCSGAVRWQTDDFSAHAATLGLVKVDRLDLMSYRPQPAGRRQVHARRNHSTLLVFRRDLVRERVGLFLG